MASKSPKKEEEKFTFFWTNESPFSQMHPSEFRGSPLLFGDYGKTEIEYGFKFCEQWMMYHKAKLFKDDAAAEKILAATNPKVCKALGRKVHNFDPDVWDQHKMAIVTEGNRLKFSQNEDLFKKLEATKGTTLVEASPSDRIWGIGLRETDPLAKNRKTWRGKNLLGQILTKVRDELMETSSGD